MVETRFHASDDRPELRRLDAIAPHQEPHERVIQQLRDAQLAIDGPRRLLGHGTCINVVDYVIQYSYHVSNK